ncbi:NmrA family protein [Rhizodiscina lignyota]|uniref:NmrA family protein n=1 Tax=Rhizodiscina lignyota TaxID=1504668 RepID=A0A9P4M8J2_9PEZI|nr:NmrA family protein [Rhizodiscina lignyota]
MAKQTVLIIGGTGAQGSAVVKALSNSGDFHVKILTRDASTTHAKDLAALPDVSLIEGDPHNEDDLFRAFKGIDATFVNTNGFAIGEKAELYWGIRIWEIARMSDVKHFVYGGLEYISKLGNYDPKFRVGHYDAKGKVEEFIKAQGTSPMAWSILNSGPYMESLNELLRPTKTDDGTYIFTAPLGQDGAMPMIHLEDLALVALWMFQNLDKSKAMELGVATEHVSWPYLVETFTAVTGKPAHYNDVPVDAWVELGFAHLPNGPDTKIGLRGTGAVENDTTFMTFRQNFTNWMNLYRASGGNKGLIQRDYKLLDEILPNRVKSLGEWMKKTGYNGDYKPLLKDIADRVA